jgi:hypothetical protein
MSYSLQLSGRLGNQLFQWAYAHNLSIFTGESIDLFVDKYHSSGAPEINDLMDCEHVKFVGFKNQLGRQLQALDWLSTRNQFISTLASSTFGWERTLDANTAPMQGSSGHLFSGFYQDYAQVKNVLEIILPELKNHSEHLLSSIKSRIEIPTVYQFAHIRRGDLAASSATYGLLEIDWYANCRNSQLPLVLSTDDLKNSEELIAQLNPVVILNPDKFSAFETLFVMGKSKELIMANSTLSWWGALIATQNGGKAYFPDPFYIGNSIITEKLCLPEFIKRPSGL